MKATELVLNSQIKHSVLDLQMWSWGETSPASHQWWCWGFAPCLGLPKTLSPCWKLSTVCHSALSLRTSPSLEPRLLAHTNVNTELLKLGLKGFPGKTSRCGFVCSNVFLVSILNTERAWGRELKTNHTAEMPLCWPLWKSRDGSCGP